MKEKVLWLSLPEGAEYQRVEVAEDGKNEIVYAEKECKSKTRTTEVAPAVPKSKAKSKAKQRAKRKPIPKPDPLIGGTEPYQKDNGTGYWYCKIKDGRDKFMYLYFRDLTENDLLYDSNGKEREFVGDRQLKFKGNCLKAIRNKPKEGFRWIPVYEPSLATDGGIQYVSGEAVLRRLNSYEWEGAFENYSPENGSGEESITTYFLLGLRWLKDGLATVKQLANDSSEIGHYYDSENAKHDFEKTGEREFGGLCGFVGNTYKEVKDSESPSGFSVLGGKYYNNGNTSPFAHVFHNITPNIRHGNRVGQLELKGNTVHC